MKKIVSAALVAAALTSSPALAASYVTGTQQFFGLGDTIGSPFDQIFLNSVAGTFNGPGTYLVNTVDFIVGTNSNNSANFTGNFTNTATVDGNTVSFTVPYKLSIDTADSITIGGNTVNYGPYRVTFNTLAFSNVGAGAPVATGDLTATVSVPEPATWSLLIIGFGAVGYAMRRRQQATVRYA